MTSKVTLIHELQIMFLMLTKSVFHVKTFAFPENLKTLMGPGHGSAILLTNNQKATANSMVKDSL